MMKQIKRIINTLIPVLVLLLLFCAHQEPMRDFFGIKMDAGENKKFKIISYSEDKGASYHGSVKMEPELYAYAQFRIPQLLIKVVNETEQPVPTNYNVDRFFLYTKKGEQFVLRKEEISDYPNKLIQPKSSQEYVLDLPSNFWETVGMTDHQSNSANYRDKFWTGLNQLRFLKSDIDYIEVRLGNDTVLILKPILESIKNK